MEPTQLGPYDIAARIGKGGMGSVYRGTNRETGQVAAIKVLAPQLAAAEGFRERFEAEIESLKTLRHDAIVRLFGYGKDQGTIFYAMELVDGTSLDEEVKAGRRFDWHETVDIAIQVCRALKHAHDHGIIHRDIKPANILIDKQGHIKLADFGIARLFGGNQLTLAGGVLGTADYMSPEQAEGRAITEKVDQYSLGCVMYALLSGRPPFRARSLPEMLQLQRFAEPEPVTRYAPLTPKQLAGAIDQLLAKDPDKRFPNVLVLGRHLEALRMALNKKEEAAAALETPQLDDDAGLAATRADSRPSVAADVDSNFDVSASLDLQRVTGAGEHDATIDSLQAVPAHRPAGPLLLIDPDQQPKPDSGHFTTVDPDARSRASTSIGQWLPPALALMTLLIAGVAGAWYFNQPADANALYEQIDMAADDENRLRQVEPQMREFLERFADDDRASEVQDLLQQVELARRQRRFGLQARHGLEREDLLPAERLYVDALRKVESNPGQALAELQGLLELPLPTSDEDTSERTATCLALARQQVDELFARMSAEAERERPLVAQTLDAIEKLHDTDPAAAERQARAFVLLYGGRPWAADLVQRAEQLLEQ